MKPSKLCFGSLTLSPLQRNLSPQAGGELMLHAVNSGVNFFDTAELYENYAHFRYLLERVRRDQVIIATKCYAYDEDTARASLEKALEEMNTDYVDFFLLHEQESEHTLRGHREAIDYFLRQRAVGRIRAFGISTHFVRAVRAAVCEPAIEVLHPIINQAGIGIADGTREEMIEAVRAAKAAGKWIYAMKALGGGHLLKDYRQALSFVLDMPFVDSIAVGMQSTQEIDQNVAFFCGKRSDVAVPAKRYLHVAEWCVGCGACVARCQQDALAIKAGKVVVNHERCTLCSYCATACPEFCLKVI